MDECKPQVTGLVLENLCLSSGTNAELVICMREWRAVVAAAAPPGGAALADHARHVIQRLHNPSA